MKQATISVTVDIRANLYSRLKEEAAARECTVQELVLAGAKLVLLKEHKPRSRRVQFPLIGSDGPKVSLTNEQIYDLIEFP
jgi:hypothetical protein